MARIHFLLAPLLCLGLTLPLGAQTALEGQVFEISEQQDTLPVTGANVYWLDGGKGTVSGSEGTFRLPRAKGQDRLVISYVGYANDTLEVAEAGFAEIFLQKGLMLDVVEVTYRKKSTSISRLKTLKVEQIGEAELMKAACCNLSESFETNPSIDVSFTDAVTGARQIQMLGLAGPYTQITLESMPGVRGFSAISGLQLIPGTWIQSIQLSKGMGSVANGFESIAGQINVELRKPDSGEKWYFNGYGSEMARLEFNAHWRHELNDRWSTGVLVHAKGLPVRHDRNGDNFLDMPLGYTTTALNRWKYGSEDGLEAQFGLKGSLQEHTGGQISFDPERDLGGDQVWGMQSRIDRLEGWAKIGKVFLDSPGSSIGLQLTGTHHRQQSWFGQREYRARQNAAYANLLFESILGNTNHQYRLGASFQLDDYAESLADTDYDRTEAVPGLWAEYTYKYLEKFTLVAGLRADYHNLFGLFITPRLHLRYAPWEKTAFRLSGGRGQRTANIISDNIGLLASSRKFNIPGDVPGRPYGLGPEVAWNFGFNFTQEFRLDYRDGTFSVDLYHTRFENQIVVDLDQSPQDVFFYDLDGRSFANSVQVQLDYELIKRLDVRLAYRWYDVRTTYHGQLLRRPLLATHRGFVNLAYETRNYWAFDYTLNWTGAKRLPFTGSNPTEYRLADASPDFVTMNVQVRKTWREKFDLYLGVENLLNFRQAEPILAANDPFGPFFDSALVWGPIFGRNVYAGFRLRIR